MSKDLTNAIRALAMDAVQAANSGHPGMPMGMAEIALALWGRHLRHNPANPKWPDRDRFVLSNGHGSMLLYALLHLTGYDLPMGELERFRQLHSKTPGHPEYGLAPGVETTTGPLGQGLANSVGMAIAERILAAEFNRPGFDIVDHHTYVSVGDGCLMEGISHEACSLAGALALGKLIALYDDNGVSIDGDDVESVDHAIGAAKAVADRPSLICCRTVIGKGAPTRAGTAKAHGEALGAEEVAATRAAIGWRYPPFKVPQQIYEGWDAKKRGAALEGAWNDKFAAYQKAHPELAREFRRRVAGELPANWNAHHRLLVEKVIAKTESIATRKASQNAIEGLAPVLPELVGGSADLTGSNLTLWSGSKPVGRAGGGNYIYYGVREFGMSAVMNGLALHGGIIPYGGTFLTFSDYSRNSLRMAALMKIRSIFVFTHDSIGLGEDGPTHQSIEHAAALRLIPGMDVWRPCDPVETALAWEAAIERKDGPTSLLLTRQNVPFQKRDAHTVSAIRRGGYVLADAQEPKAVILATGSEVQLALGAKQKLAEEGISVRVVSMPCTSIFDRQPPMYRDVVLIPTLPKVAVEAGVSDYWRKYVGLEGDVVGIDRYGESAPGAKLFEYFGFTVDNVVKTVKSLLK